jgi:hypothetical protein
MDGLAVVLLIVFFTIIFGLLFSIGEVEKVRSNWAEHRCKPGVMFSGFLYKPDNDTRSSSEFAMDNFSFCMKSLAQSVMQGIMAPIFNSFKSLVGNAESAAGSVNNMRFGMGNMFGGFTSIINGFHHKFQAAGMQFMRISNHLKMSFNRIFGIILSMFYAGLSSFIGSSNLIAFIIRVIITILLIILAVFIILIFVLFPFMPIIMSVMAVIAVIVTVFTSIVVGALSDIQDGFCFAPETMIIMRDGSMKPINVIKVGDILKGGIVVEGALEFDGTDVHLFDYKGVHVSGEHIVRDSRRGWVKISDLRLSLAYKQTRIYSLITSNNRIPVHGQDNSIIEFADWEEFPDDSSISHGWHELVQAALKIPVKDRRSPTASAASIDESVYVQLSNGDRVPINSVKIDDWIADKDNNGTLKYVRVIGKCLRDVEETTTSQLSPGIWLWSNNKWIQEDSGIGDEAKNNMRYHLITTSGTFIVFLSESAQSSICIRDFTEVGICELKKMSSDVVNMLNCPPRM